MNIRGADYDKKPRIPAISGGPQPLRHVKIPDRFPVSVTGLRGASHVSKTVGL